MILLPTPINRVRLRLFWLILSLASIVVLLLVVPLPLRSRPASPLGFGALLVAVLAAAGLIWPYRVQWVYRGWNYVARRVGRYVERYVTAVGFATVMLALSVGASTARFERSPAAGSMWRARGTQGPDTYFSQYNDPSVGGRDATWLLNLRAWGRTSGHGHSVVLLPFVWLLRATAPGTGDDVGTVQANIYTLY